MASWRDYFLPLQQAARQISSDDTQTIKNTAIQAEPDDQPAEETEILLCQEIARGMEVALEDLQTLECGWLYYGQPVMVYGVEVAACDDPELRRQFARRIHLGPCCGALEEASQSAWVCSDWQQLSGGDYELCPHCLSWSNHQNFRHLDTQQQRRVFADFNFTHYVRLHSQQYFSDCIQPELISRWRPGQEISSSQWLISDQPCDECDWQTEDAVFSSVRAEHDSDKAEQSNQCILCQQRHDPAVLAVDDRHLLNISRQRYHYWCEQANTREPELDWAKVEHILPLSWQPLLQALRPHISAPALFVTFVGYHGEAVLAWPQHRRGIVETAQAGESLPADWEFWTAQQTLNSLR